MSLNLTYLQVLLNAGGKQLFTIILKSILTLLKCPASPNLRGTLLYLNAGPAWSILLYHAFFVVVVKHRSCIVQSASRFGC